jgi:hypothetical protein
VNVRFYNFAEVADIERMGNFVSEPKSVSAASRK